MSYSEIRNKAVVTRKATGCAWCAERINAGEKAQSRSYVFEGEMQSDHMHPECYDAMLRYPDQVELLDGWMAGDFARGSISDEPEERKQDVSTIG
jgi:hypothetical protein